MRSTALFFGAALCCAAASVVSPASAQSANLAEAKKRMTEAKALYGKGDFEQSRLKYVEACSIARTDNCIRSLAVAELAAGRPADAYVHFQEVARSTGAAKLSPAAARDLNELIQEAYAKCGHVEVSAPSGTLLSIDDQPAAGVPADVVAVAPGSHTFEAQRGDRHKRVVLEATVGKVVRVAFTEEDLAAPGAVPSTGVPVTAVTTTTGRAAPTVDREGETRTWPPAGAWVFGGAALVGAGVGIGFAVAANSQNNTVANAGTACANPSSSACQPIKDAQSARDRDHDIAYAGFIAGGASLVAAVIWTAVTHRSPSTSAWISPEIAPGRAGLRAITTF
jgi:hypothetical protein